jgi:hypothetical protein
MLDGVYLTLMAGPVVAVPVPQTVLDALTGVTVTTAAGQPSGFELTFSVSRRSPLQTLFLLTGGSIPPILRVILAVTINGIPEVIMDGVMTNHQVSPGPADGSSTLTIKGKDLTALMNWIPFDGLPYPAMPVPARVLLILAKYAVFGLVPLVLPTVLTDTVNPLDRIYRQKGTDLNYIKQLAHEAGYTFYIEPGPLPGASIAYWGPEVRVGPVQPALSIDMDAHSNIESLQFTFDNECSVLPILFYFNETLKVVLPIPVPDVSLLNPPLGLIPPIPNRLEMLNGMGPLNPVQLLLRGVSQRARASDAVKGEGTLDVLRYGRLLKARRLVGVRGAGPAFDGLYFVQSVTHKLKRGEYKQSFTVVRNGLLSTLPQVPV